MKISWNWLSEFVDLSQIPPEELSEKLTLRGLEVDEIHHQARGFEKVITAQILERKAHPQADRLSLCLVTVGQGEPLEIVCGAQNMKAGDRVALAQVGAILPNNSKIEKSKIRGVFSYGMLCSETELKLKEKSEGILILPTETPVGKPLAEILGLEDVLLTFKLTANRGDCLSHFGIAREVAAALKKPLKEPQVKILDWKGSPFVISLETQDAPQFFGCYIEGVEIKPSPAWLVKRLENLGFRSINTIVDATNLVMLEFGHPMHAYDADQLQDHSIHVRFSNVGESLPLLDGQTVTLTGKELVIADGGADGKKAPRAIALAGVMGGGNSEVKVSTTKVFLECALFSPVLVRQAALRYQRHTEASHRFERGVDPMGLARAISRLAQVILDLSGGRIVGSGFSSLKNEYPEKKIKVTPTFFNSFLGTPFEVQEIEDALKAQGCQVQPVYKEKQTWVVTPPSHRLDLCIKEDLAEEVARSIGFDKIPSSVPLLSSVPSSNFQDFTLLKEVLVGAGMHETINFAFVNPAWLKKIGFTSQVHLLNPISEELSSLTPSLIPGLIKNALDNQRRHFGSSPLAIRLFEIRPTFHHKTSQNEVQALSEIETTVDEKWKVAFLLSGPRYAEGLRADLKEVDFSDAKAVLDLLIKSLQTKGVRFKPGQEVFLHPGQSVEILAEHRKSEGKGEEKLGYLGRLHPTLEKEFKFRAPIWVAELDLETLLKLSRPLGESRSYEPWPEFPPMERDFALIVKKEMGLERIVRLALKAGQPLAKEAKIFDLYEGAQVGEGMTSVAVRVIFFDSKRSLREEEIQAVSSQILDSWKKELGALLRSS